MPDPRSYIDALNSALSFAVEHGLTDVYRAKFAGINPNDLTPAAAAAAGQEVAFPIWEIANELLVARYLERVFGWQFVGHEPAGDKLTRGDWQFVTPSGREVFVEVKSIAEAPYHGGVFAANFAPRLRKLVARAYRQLPADGRAVLLVLVGGVTLDAPRGSRALGHLFSALFGDYQITFNVLPFDPRSVKAGPSFWDMAVQSKKHRRLGCIAALTPGGMLKPEFDFYAIHNPYAYLEVKLPTADLEDAEQFVVGQDGYGDFVGHVPDAWRRMDD